MVGIMLHGFFYWLHMHMQRTKEKIEITRKVFEFTVGGVFFSDEKEP